MKIVTIIFIYAAYAFGKLLIINSTTPLTPVELPVLVTPDFEFRDLSAGCGGFVDCIEYVGAVLYNIGLGIIYLVLLLVALTVYIIQFIAVLVAVSFVGFGGDAPAWLNALAILPFAAALGLIIYKLIRRGSSNDD